VLQATAAKLRLDRRRTIRPSTLERPGCPGAATGRPLGLAWVQRRGAAAAAEVLQCRRDGPQAGASEV